MRTPGRGWSPVSGGAYDPRSGCRGHRRVPAFMAGPVFAALGRFFSRVVPEPVQHALGSAVRVVGTLGGLAFRIWPWVVLVAACGATIVVARRRRGAATRAATRSIGEAAFIELVDALTPAGHAREPSETAAEFLRGVEADPSLAVVRRRCRRARRAHVRTGTVRATRGQPSEAESLRARAAAAQVRHLVARHSTGLMCRSIKTLRDAEEPRPPKTSRPPRSNTSARSAATAHLRRARTRKRSRERCHRWRWPRDPCWMRSVLGGRPTPQILQLHRP